MSGRFIPSVRFPIYVEDCKDARIQVEPIFCQGGYGLLVKVILTLVGGTGDNAYEYERIVRQEVITQASLPENTFYETSFEFMEGFYYNKVSQDVVVPLVAMVLRVYMSDLVELCQLDLSGYFLDLEEPKKKGMGYRGDG